MNREWTVRVVMATQLDVSDTELDAMADAAEAADAVVARRAGRPGVVATVDVELDDPVEAASWACDYVRQLADKAGGYEPNVSAIVDLRVCAPDIAEADALRPDTPELLAATDVAGLLGVSRQRVHQLATDHPQFPAPYARLGSGPIWTRPVIEHFAANWARKPGRPARPARAS